MANSVDPDQMLQNAASDLGLHCLHGPICPNTWSYYGKDATFSQKILTCFLFLHKLMLWMVIGSATLRCFNKYSYLYGEISKKKWITLENFK